MVSYMEVNLAFFRVTRRINRSLRNNPAQPFDLQLVH
ncbi:MAG: hypothetical protein QOJ51_571 [Acidobacteriaceae bacterium]|jgi:hypothetical protein|nr:hypothetical protein [Acidobacteriaceae bacterium]MDX6461996.1 hypothetical protein [Acidobacteriaceae bacterium]MEA2257746.1 hypothetical protein [Acidobacteriaceae bacterium]